MPDLPAGPPRGWGRIKQRRDYQRVGKGKRLNGRAALLQANARVPEEADLGPRFGLTVTKKTGNSPARNRIRRRLREAVRRISTDAARANYDYVLVARREALSLRFDVLAAEIASALRRIGADRKDAPPGNGPK